MVMSTIYIIQLGSLKIHLLYPTSGLFTIKSQFYSDWHLDSHNSLKIILSGIISFPQLDYCTLHSSSWESTIIQAMHTVPKTQAGEKYAHMYLLQITFNMKVYSRDIFLFI